MIGHILNQDCTIIPTTRDVHGDQREGNPIATKCRFRYLTGLERGINMEAVSGIDAMIWFAPDEPVVEGTIIGVDDKKWRVDRLVKARRMSGDTVYFLKAFVTKYAS